jgi:hypothetical protein
MLAVYQTSCRKIVAKCWDIKENWRLHCLQRVGEEWNEEHYFVENAFKLDR